MKTIDFLDFMQLQVKHLHNSQRFGTAKNYEKTMRSFSTFLEKSTTNFSSMTDRVILDYDYYLIKKGLTRNSRSFYMRNLRSAYNKAVKQKIAKPTNLFIDVYTGIDKTKKRAVDESIITRLYKIDLEDNSQIALARDIFIFSYCTRGMSFVDIAYLKKSDIIDGVIRYCRRKTGQMLSVKVESCVRYIINRYMSNESEYVFPIITSADNSEAYKQYRSAINVYNRMLKRLSKEIGYGNSLSSYTARHSWATAARKHHIPISVISAGMGHSSELTTQIYLKSIEDNEIDEANAEIIKLLR